MAKQLSFSNESREALEKGVNFVANAVKVTIGPKAKNVVIEKNFGSPDIVRDGSTVAKEIEIENPISNLGAKFFFCEFLLNLRIMPEICLFRVLI